MSQCLLQVSGMLRRSCRMVVPGCIALWCCLWAVMAQAAALRLEAPEQVARGDAFLALAVSDVPVQEVVFAWRGKEWRAQAETVVTPQGTQAWQAVMLLSVPLEAKEKRLFLSASAAGGSRSPQAAVTLFDRKRPVQKLTVDKKYVDPPAKVMERIRRDREQVKAALASYSPVRQWALPLTRPVPGGISSLYGLKRVFNGQPRGYHRGLDLRGASGTPIKACADGRVVLCDDLYFSGKTVYLDHGQGVFTAYLHMSELLVRNGQEVRKGQVIGKVGATGRVTGPHLHLSLIVQGQSVDVEPLLAPWEEGAAQPAAAAVPVAVQPLK
ncbi:M23 family metallopeptidase [uncultured Desulfovibrio sp.]|uniref:M23 family metallopeptidase n=1 Tax=uncultured Desulfovibrio sp. TaxID=167968 RepID=UPI00261CA796|nr:M23 family metallopeptidase [uncultured Desulfovibrio sp.]